MDRPHTIIANGFSRTTTSGWWTHHRTRSERGGALVEFGLVAPIFVTLLIGSITTGLAFNTSSSLNNSARESARYGATLAIDDDLTTWLNNVSGAAFAAAGDELVPGAEGHILCVAYVHPDGTDVNDRTMQMVTDESGTTVLAGVGCFADGRPANEPRVQVSMGRDTSIETVLTSNAFELERRSVARYERIAG